MKRIATIALSTALLTSSTFALAAQQSWKNESLDAWIDGKAETTLLLNTNLNSFDINTDVKAGVVTLTGDVNSKLEKSLAEELVTGLDGVKEVKNELSILDDKRKTTQSDENKTTEDDEKLSTLTDAKITTVLKTRLLMARDISAMDIEVTTTGGIVELTGKVKSNTERDLVVNMARNAEDVKSVDDKLEIVK